MKRKPFSEARIGIPENAEASVTYEAWTARLGALEVSDAARRWALENSKRNRRV